MGKPVKQRNKIMAFLPTAASPVTFQASPPVSPVGRGTSSGPNPTVSLIPKGAPRKSRNGSFDAREPASPKVSCMGKIQCKKRKMESFSKPKLAFTHEMKRKALVRVNVLKGTKRGHESDVSNAETEEVAAERVPSLGQMKQFSRARGTLPRFDCRAYDAEREGAS